MRHITSLTSFKMAYSFASGIELTFTNDNIAIIRMRNGENRIDKTFIDAFNKALDTVERNSQCRALITTGEGKFFSNGFNLELVMKTNEESVRIRLLSMKLNRRLLTFPLPTIAAINGHAFAGGALLAVNHDFRVMQTKRGWISLNEIFLKISLRFSITLLRHLIIGDISRLRHFSALYTKERHKSRKKQLTTLPNAFDRSKFSGRTPHDLVIGKRFTAEEAKEGGVVDVVCTPEALMSSAKDLANQFNLKQKYDRDMLRAFKEDLYRAVLDGHDKAFKAML